MMEVGSPGSSEHRLSLSDCNDNPSTSSSAEPASSFAPVAREDPAADRNNLLPPLPLPSPRSLKRQRARTRESHDTNADPDPNNDGGAEGNGNAPTSSHGQQCGTRGGGGSLPSREQQRRRSHRVDERQQHRSDERVGDGRDERRRARGAPGTERSDAVRDSRADASSRTNNGHRYEQSPSCGSVLEVQNPTVVYDRGMDVEMSEPDVKAAIEDGLSMGGNRVEAGSRSRHPVQINWHGKPDEYGRSAQESDIGLCSTRKRRRSPSLMGRSPLWRGRQSKSRSRSPRWARSRSRSPPWGMRQVGRGGEDRGELLGRGRREQEQGPIHEPCIFYMRGRCNRGSFCRFSHPRSSLASNASFDERRMSQGGGGRREPELCYPNHYESRGSNAAKDFDTSYRETDRFLKPVLGHPKHYESRGSNASKEFDAKESDFSYQEKDRLPKLVLGHPRHYEGSGNNAVKEFDANKSEFSYREMDRLPKPVLGHSKRYESRGSNSEKEFDAKESDSSYWEMDRPPKLILGHPRCYEVSGSNAVKEFDAKKSEFCYQEMDRPPKPVSAHSKHYEPRGSNAVKEFNARESDFSYRETERPPKLVLSHPRHHEASGSNAVKEFDTHKSDFSYRETDRPPKPVSGHLKHYELRGDNAAKDFNAKESDFSYGEMDRPPKLVSRHPRHFEASGSNAVKEFDAHKSDFSYRETDMLPKSVSGHPKHYESRGRNAAKNFDAKESDLSYREMNRPLKSVSGHPKHFESGGSNAGREFDAKESDYSYRKMDRPPKLASGHPRHYEASGSNAVKEFDAKESDFSNREMDRRPKPVSGHPKHNESQGSNAAKEFNAEKSDLSYRETDRLPKERPRKISSTPVVNKEKNEAMEKRVHTKESDCSYQEMDILLKERPLGSSSTFINYENQKGLEKSLLNSLLPTSGKELPLKDSNVKKDMDLVDTPRDTCLVRESRLDSTVNRILPSKMEKSGTELAKQDTLGVQPPVISEPNEAGKDSSSPRQMKQYNDVSPSVAMGVQLPSPQQGNPLSQPLFTSSNVWASPSTAAYSDHMKQPPAAVLQSVLTNSLGASEHNASGNLAIKLNSTIPPTENIPAIGRPPAVHLPMAQTAPLVGIPLFIPSSYSSHPNTILRHVFPYPVSSMAAGSGLQSAASQEAAPSSLAHPSPPFVGNLPVPPYTASSINPGIFFLTNSRASQDQSLIRSITREASSATFLSAPLVGSLGNDGSRCNITVADAKGDNLLPSVDLNNPLQDAHEAHISTSVMLHGMETKASSASNPILAEPGYHGVLEKGLIEKEESSVNFCMESTQALGVTLEPANPEPVASVLEGEEGGDDEADFEQDENVRNMKLLKSAVAEYVKDALKPAWREGHISKEAFKTIAKKAVDKVAAAMQGHQIPKTQEKLDIFMASSHTKITKLLQGYVGKYTKA